MEGKKRLRGTSPGGANVSPRGDQGYEDSQREEGGETQEEKCHIPGPDHRLAMMEM